MRLAAAISSIPTSRALIPTTAYAVIRKKTDIPALAKVESRAHNGSEFAQCSIWTEKWHWKETCTEQQYWLRPPGSALINCITLTGFNHVVPGKLRIKTEEPHLRFIITP